MSYNGSGTFSINTAGQPVVDGTTITSTAFNLLTADLATGLTTAICKDGQTTATQRIPFAAGLGLGNGTVSSPALNFANDTGCGFYRIGSADIGFSIGGTKVWDVTASSTVFSQTGQFTRLGLGGAADSTSVLTLSGASQAAARMIIYNTTFGSTGLTIDQDNSGTATIDNQAAASLVLATNNAGIITIRNAADTYTTSIASQISSAGHSFGLKINAGTNASDAALLVSNQSDGADLFKVLGNADVQFGKALVALGGGSLATLGTVGGSGPATTAQDTWLRLIDSTGAAFWVPAWK